MEGRVKEREGMGGAGEGRGGRVGKEQVLSSLVDG